PATATTAIYTLSLHDALPIWSPDNQWLVYESYQGGNLDIYIMKLEGADTGQTLRLTSHAEPDFSPAWSPDGRRIAFVSWRDGSQDRKSTRLNSSHVKISYAVF